MLFSLIIYLISLPTVVYAQSLSINKVVDYVTAPGGHIVYYIMSLPDTDAMGNRNMVIEEGVNEDHSFRILLHSHPANNPKDNLTNFSHLVLSPDNKMLYFETSAWATSGAIHAIDLSTKKVVYVTHGAIACVVLAGEFQNGLIVEQHRYFLQGGSHDDLWLYDPSGREIGMVAENTDSSRVCPVLGK